MKIISSKKADMACIDKIPNENIKIILKRQLRKPLLEAFDVYKSNVYYGIINETETQHAKIISWYQGLCDLEISSLIEIPTAVKKYL